MFRNANKDPLAIPTPVQRRSVGPRRTAAGGPPADRQWFGDPKATFSSEGTGTVGAGGGWEQDYDRMAEDELHRRHQERGGEGNADPRDFYAGVPWAETKLPGLRQHEVQDLDRHGWGGDEEGDYWADKRSQDYDEGHDFSQYTTSPEFRPGIRPPGEYGDQILAFSADDFADLGWNSHGHHDLDHSENEKVSSTLDKEARNFLGSESDCSNAEELLYRAERHAKALTSTWSTEASRKTTEAFCGRVAALIPRPRRTAAAPAPTVHKDFDDSLFYC